VTESERTPPAKGEWDGPALLAGLGVLAMMGLAALAVPTASRLLAPRPMHCASNLRQISLAIKQYAQDNHEKFPSGFPWGRTTK